MKQQWLKLITRLDAMSLRERAMVFAGSAAAIVFLVYSMLLDPLLARQKALLAQISQQQNQVAGIDMEITGKVAAFGVDPDEAVRAQLKQAGQESDKASAALRALQKGLVAPERIAPLLEHLLRGNGRLQLLSLNTLPVSGISEIGAGFDAVTPAAQPAPAAAQPAATAAAAAGAVAKPAAPAKPPELLYRHGVELVLQGGYVDMVNYMAALEALPSQLFWGKAKLDAGDYPNARLTLTLYTLSLDKKWISI
ncbi:type II secretion system protein GspM [Rugamonas sp. DEMB1]|uniref:type II secretion system protein GspM n=1 Tax=Rugamonas sp. DEMB1 TaxID=3039386 RepID=UPI0024490E94|nr:type II secretion system protein GspM [Rugamonas sp. DEMB1]WGG52684.1 type II secretion system protein GspM [Rugamonas sp. DEMB1]